MQNVPSGTFGNMPISIQSTQPMQQTQFPINQLTPLQIKKKEETYVLSEKISLYYHFIKMNIEVYSIPLSKSTRNMINLKLDPKMFLSNKGASSLKRFYDDSEEGFFFPSLKIKITDKLIDKYFKHIQTMDKKLLAQNGIDVEQLNFNKDTLRASKIELFTKKSKLAMFLSTIDNKFLDKDSEENEYLFNKILNQIRWEPIYVILTFFRLFIDYKEIDNLKKNDTFIFLMFLVLQYSNENVNKSSTNYLSFENVYPLIYNFLNTSSFIDEKNKDFINCNPNSYPYHISFDTKNPEIFYNSIKDSKFFDKLKLKEYFNLPKTSSLREGRHIEANIKKIENEINKLMDFRYLYPISSSFTHSKEEIVKILMIRDLHENVLKKHIKKDSNGIPKKEFTSFLHIRNSIYNDIVKILDPNNETSNSNKLYLLGFPSSKKVKKDNRKDNYNNLFLLPSFPLLAMNFSYFNMEHQNTDENHEVLVEHVLSLFNSHYHFTQNQRDITNITPVGVPPGTINDCWMLYPGYNKPYYVNETDNTIMHYYSNIFLTELEFLVRNTKEIVRTPQTIGGQSYARRELKNSVRVTKKIKETNIVPAPVTTHFTPGILDGFMFIQLPFNSDSANESNIYRFDNYSYNVAPPGHNWSPMLRHSNANTDFDPNSVATFENSIYSVCHYLNEAYHAKSPLVIEPVLPEAIIQKYKFAQYQLCLNYFYYRNVKVKASDRFYPTNNINLSKIFDYVSNNGIQRKEFHNRFDEDANHTYIFHKLVSHKLNENFKIDKSLFSLKEKCKNILQKYLFDSIISDNNDNANLHFNLRYTDFYTNHRLQPIVNPMNDDAWFLEHPQFIDISGAAPTEPEKLNMYNKLRRVFIKRLTMGRNPLMTGHTGTHALPAKMDDNIVMQVSYLYSCFKRWSDGNIEDVYNLLYRIIRYGINSNFYHTYNTGEDDGRTSTVEQDINVTDRTGRIIMEDVDVTYHNAYRTNDNLVDIDRTRLSYNDTNTPPPNPKIRMTNDRNNNYKNFIPNKPNTNEIPNMYDNVGSPMPVGPLRDARTITEYPLRRFPRGPSYSGFVPYELHPFLIFNYLNPTQSGSGYSEEIAEFTIITWLYCILYHLKNSYLYLLTTFYFMNKTEYVSDFNTISEYYLKTKMYEKTIDLDRGNNEYRIDKNNINSPFFDKEMMEFVIRNTMKELIMNFIDKHILESYYKKKENTNDDYDNVYGLYNELMSLIKEEDIENKENMKEIIDRWGDVNNKEIIVRDDMFYMPPMTINLLINRKSHMKDLFYNGINKDENNILLTNENYYSDEYYFHRMRMYYDLNLNEIDIIKGECKKEIENIEYLNEIEDIMKMFRVDNKNEIVKNIVYMHEKKMEKCRIIINEELKNKKTQKEEVVEKLKNEYLRDEYRKELRLKEEEHKNAIEKIKDLSKNLEMSNFFIINTNFMYKGVHEFIKNYITNIKNIFELFRKNILISGRTDEKEMNLNRKIEGLTTMIEEFENKIIQEKNLKVTIQMMDIKNILYRFEKKLNKNVNIDMMLKIFDTKQREDSDDITTLELALRDKNQILYHNFYYVLNLLLDNNSFVWMDENGMRTATKLLLTNDDNKICEQYDFEKDKFMCDLQETRGVINVKIESKFYDEDMDVGFIERLSVGRDEICRDSKNRIKEEAINTITNLSSNMKYIGKQLGFLDE